MGLYQRAIINIKQALSHECPKNMIYQLTERMGKCENLLNKNGDKFRQYESERFLFCPKPGISELSYCLKLANNEQYGNHIITTIALKAGNIVGLTQPFFKFFDQCARLHHCSYCLREDFLDLLPCQLCRVAMFCTNQCAKAASKEFHQFECCVTYNPKDPISDFAPLKMFLKILSTFNDSVYEMRKFLSIHTQPVTSFDLETIKLKIIGEFDENLGSAEIEIIKRANILMALSLNNNADLDVTELMRYQNEFISHHQKLERIFRSEKHSKFLNDLMCKLCKLTSLKSISTVWSSKCINMVHESESKSSLQLDNLPVFINRIATVIDQRVGLLNHSCAPNIRLQTVDNHYAWIVMRPIAAGEQLFRSYGEEFLLGPSAAERQQNLMKEYGFLCQCEACVNDWPTARNLNCQDPGYIFDTSDLLARDRPAAISKFYKNCSYINKKHQNYPCKELCFAMAVNTYKLGALAASSFFP